MVRPGALAFAACLLFGCAEPRPGASLSPSSPARGAQRLSDPLAGYPRDFSEKVPQAPVPVLLPPSDGLLEPALVVEPGFWSFFAKLPGGAWLSLHAAARAHHYSELSEPVAPHRVRGAGGLALLNEGIWTVTFQEEGTAYALDLGCAHPLDPRCADAVAAIALADSLARVGGGGR